MELINASLRKSHNCRAIPRDTETMKLVCSKCRCPLTVDLHEVDARGVADGVCGQPWLPPDTFAIDDDHDTELPVHRARTIVVRPDALLDGTVVVSGRVNGCCGFDGMDGPNQSCANCGRVLGTARTDCWQFHEVRFKPGAIIAIADSR
jgi:hypothetical protein